MNKVWGKRINLCIKSEGRGRAVKKGNRQRRDTSEERKELQSGNK